MVLASMKYNIKVAMAQPLPFPYSPLITDHFLATNRLKVTNHHFIFQIVCAAAAATRATLPPTEVKQLITQIHKKIRRKFERKSSTKKNL